MLVAFVKTYILGLTPLWTTKGNPNNAARRAICNLRWRLQASTKHYAIAYLGVSKLMDRMPIDITTPNFNIVHRVPRFIVTYYTIKKNECELVLTS